MSFKTFFQSIIIVALLAPVIAFSQQSHSASLSQGTQPENIGKPISKDLFGVFFEDLSYAADGGLYAELVQNRSFEYSASDRKEWNPLTGWEYTT